MNHTHHQAGYGFLLPGSSQPFPVDARWENQVWAAPYVCVIRFLIMQMRALTNFAGVHTFDWASELVYERRGLRPGHPCCKQLTGKFSYVYANTRGTVNHITRPRELGAPKHTPLRPYAHLSLSLVCARHLQLPAAIGHSKSTDSVEQSAGLCVGSSTAICADRTPFHSRRSDLVQCRL